MVRLRIAALGIFDSQYHRPRDHRGRRSLPRTLIPVSLSQGRGERILLSTILRYIRDAEEKNLLSRNEIYIGHIASVASSVALAAGAKTYHIRGLLLTKLQALNTGQDRKFILEVLEAYRYGGNEFQV